MPYQYTAENHDWDLTMRAAWSLLMTGQAVDRLPTPGSPEEKRFSCFVGSMLLSFSAIESFSASVAFVMPRQERFNGFDFEKYRRSRRFWDKIEFLFAAIPRPIDKSQGLFQTIADMQDWRNSVTHSSPYEVEATEIADTILAPRELHKPFRGKEYTRKVTLDQAQKFYRSAIEYIELLKDVTGLEPRATVTYGPGGE